MHAVHAVDPGCGMAVDRRTALVVEHRGNPYFFCTKACSDTFRDDPERWLPREGARPFEHVH